MLRLALLAALLLAPALGAQIVLSGTSYSQNFNSLGSGLPTGITCRTPISATDNGYSIVPSPTPKEWHNASLQGNFYNFASATGMTGSEDVATQNAALNRSLGIRQSGSYGDASSNPPTPPCFLFTISSTPGFTGFAMSLDLMMLSVQPRSTTWTIEYRIGTTGTFTVIGTYNDPGAFGTTPFSYNFGSALDNVNGTIELRVAALNSSTGTGTRDSFGIDNFSLTWSVAATPPPTITGIAPNTGPAAGGTSVTITGTNLSGASVTIGGAAATGVSASATSISCTTPAGSAGAADVVVTTAGGNATLVGGFTYGAGPTINTIAPQQGPAAGGTSVTIDGANLSGATSVLFGASAATITANTANQIVCTAPAGSGVVSVSVTTANGSDSVSGAFTYIAAPVVQLCTPGTGPDTGGANVTITGLNLAGATSVLFGGAAATNVASSAGSITCTTPSHVAGTVDISVTTPGGSHTLTGGFVYTVSGTPIFSLKEGAAGAQLTDGAPVATGGYRDYGSLNVAGGTLSRTFVVQNNGSASLTVNTVVFAAASADFTLTATGLPAAVSAGGTYSFTVTFDPGSAGAKAAQVQITHTDAGQPSPFSLNVAGNGVAQSVALVFATASPLADGVLGVAYTPVQFSVSGGSAPYTYSLASGTLPAGLTLSATGLLSGTISAAAATGPYSFTVRALDSANAFNDKVFALTVRANPTVGGAGGGGSGGGGCSTNEDAAWILAVAMALCCAVALRRRMA
ncbi:MAG: IPT/TIG domain-containing protein [Planctomycetes bacterium]|nr:IPT/TIG domain-containing protein [Planctomycetota bacterium]